ERLHDLCEDRDAAGQDRRPVRAQPWQLERLDAPRGDDAADDLLRRRRADAPLDEPELVRDLADRADGPRRADRARPPQAAELRDDRPQLETDGEPRALEALLAQLAVAEVELRQLHAADRQALELPWLVA